MNVPVGETGFFEDLETNKLKRVVFRTNFLGIGNIELTKSQEHSELSPCVIFWCYTLPIL